MDMGREKVGAYLDAVQSKPSDPTATAHTRRALIEYLQCAAFDPDLPIEGVREALRLARRQAMDDDNDFEHGAADTIATFLTPIEEQRRLIEPLREGTNRTLLILLRHEGEMTGTSLAQTAADADDRLASLRALDLAFGARAGRETLWRITETGTRALDLAQKLLGTISS